MISSFISSYSFSTLFIKTNSSWLILESIRYLEFMTSILLNLDFANVLFYHVFIINYWLILFNSCSYCTNVNPIAELVTPIGIPIKEAKAEMQTHPVTEEVKIRKYLI